jgi:hypothetical protein
MKEQQRVYRLRMTLLYNEWKLRAKCMGRSSKRDNMIGTLHTLNGGRTLFIWPLRTMILLSEVYHVRGTRI